MDKNLTPERPVAAAQTAPKKAASKPAKVAEYGPFVALRVPVDLPAVPPPSATPAVCAFRKFEGQHRVDTSFQDDDGKQFAVSIIHN